MALLFLIDNPFYVIPSPWIPYQLFCKFDKRIRLYFSDCCMRPHTTETRTNKNNSFHIPLICILLSVVDKLMTDISWNRMDGMDEGVNFE